MTIFAFARYSCRFFSKTAFCAWNNVRICSVDSFSTSQSSNLFASCTFPCWNNAQAFRVRSLDSSAVAFANATAASNRKPSCCFSASCKSWRFTLSSRNASCKSASSGASVASSSNWATRVSVLAMSSSKFRRFLFNLANDRFSIFATGSFPRRTSPSSTVNASLSLAPPGSIDRLCAASWNLTASTVSKWQ